MLDPLVDLSTSASMRVRIAGSSKIATSTLPSMCKGAGSAFGEG